MDKIPNWTKSQSGQNPKRTKSPIEQNPEWTKSRIGQNRELNEIPNGKNPERTKSKMDKISNGQNPGLNQLQR